MKIRKLHLKNIGVFDDEEIVFQPCGSKDKAEIHIFTGQNGSGKSTILMALASAFDVFKTEHGSLIKPGYLSNDFHKRFRFENDTKPSFSVTLDVLKDYVINIEGDFGTKLARARLLSLDNQSYLFWSDSLINTNGGEQSSDFAIFAFSGYRQIKSERIEAIKEPPNFNPLNQALEFIKDYSKSEQLTINQLIANNISKSAIERNRNKEKSEKFAMVVQSIEQAIWEITNWKVEFDLETEPTKLISKINGKDLDFDVLPDGLRSLISWIADLAGRIDLLKWQDDLPIFEKNLILFLDEIEIHLHPAWQRKVLPVVQKLFKNSQIFISTHSPFVINSVDDAWVYKLELENGKARVADVVLSEDGLSYQTVLREIFGIDKRFGDEAQNKLDDFYRQRDFILKANGKGKIKKKDFLKLAKDLASQSAELQSLVFLELARLSKETGEPYEI